MSAVTSDTQVSSRGGRTSAWFKSSLADLSHIQHWSWRRRSRERKRVAKLCVVLLPLPSAYWWSCCCCCYLTVRYQHSQDEVKPDAFLNCFTTWLHKHSPLHHTWKKMFRIGLKSKLTHVFRECCNVSVCLLNALWTWPQWGFHNIHSQWVEALWWERMANMVWLRYAD